MEAHTFREIGVILMCVLFGAAGQIFLKIGAADPTLAGLLGGGQYPSFMMRALLSPAVILGLTLYAASTALWLVVLARFDLSYAYPFVSLGFVATTVYGWQILGEAMSLQRLLGTALIIGGVILVSRS